MNLSYVFFNPLKGSEREPQIVQGAHFLEHLSFAQGKTYVMGYNFITSHLKSAFVGPLVCNKVYL